MTKRIGPRMLKIQRAVEAHPGQTAHWHGQQGTAFVHRQRWGRVYAAFQRAARAGLVVARRDGYTTVYDPQEVRS